MAVTTWGTWWTLLWLWLYGVLFAASNPIWHECGHRTAFKSKIYNDIDPDIIIHLAAVSHANKSNKDPHSTFDHSLRTLENTLEPSTKR